jgi:hypothetical protein
MNHIATTLQKQSPIQWIMGGLSLGAQCDESLPYSVDVKNTRSFTSTPYLCLHGAVLN